MKKDNDISCGMCEYFRIDEPVHNIGHCTINRMERFAGDVEEKCTHVKRRKKNEQ